MNLLTTATLTWFDDGCCDVKYLDEWQHVPTNYTPAQTDTSGWHTDHHEVVIAHDEDGRLFSHAADLLMRYQFYPRHILTHVSEFGLQDRWAAVGDRIAQRIHILGLFGRPVVDVISMTEISDVIIEPHRCGFTYITVATHVEQGEWSVSLTWRPNGDLVLTMDAVSRPVPQEPSRNYPFMRAYQKVAHQQGIANFCQMVLADETAVA